MSLEAFKKQILPTKDKLYRFALSIVKDDDEAKDVVQEVLIKAWNKQSEIDQLNNAEAWCMRLTRNLSLDKLKSKHVKYRSDLDEVAEAKQKHSITPLFATEVKDTMNKIGRFIANLPEKQRQVVQLRDVEGYSYNDISDILEIDLNQVKVNLFRARKSLRESLIKINEYGL